MKKYFLFILFIISIGCEVDINSCEISRKYLIAEKNPIEPFYFKIKCPPEVEKLRIQLRQIQVSSIKSCIKHISYFSCPFIGYGKYKFGVNDEPRFSKPKVLIRKSVHHIFDFKKSKPELNLVNGEGFSIRLKPKDRSFAMDFSKFQLYIYVPKSDIRNQTEFYFKMDQNRNLYSFDGNYQNTLDDVFRYSKYYVAVFENDDLKNGFIGILDTITYLKISVDKYFFLELGIINFISEKNFYPTYSFKVMSDEDYIAEIKCNELSMYFSESHNYNCVFKPIIFRRGKYGNVRLTFFKNELYTFSSREIHKTTFEVNHREDTDKIYIKFSNNDKNFYFESIDSFYIKYGDNIQFITLQYELRNNLAPNSRIFKIEVDKNNGYYYYADKIQRILYEIEKIKEPINAYYYFEKEPFVRPPLDKIYFEPDYIFIGYKDSFNLKRPILHFENVEKAQKYYPIFCSNIQDNNEILIFTYEVTRTFECEPLIGNTIIIKSLSITEPGIIYTQIRRYTTYATLKVIRIDVENECQNIYGYDKNKENVFVHFYIPKMINLSLFNTGKYKLKSVPIQKNPFDYEYRYITTNEGKEGSIPVSYKDFSFSINYYYSSYSLPSLGQRIKKIDSRENIESINIKFLEPITIGIEEIRNNFYLGSEKCILQEDRQTLNCPTTYNQNSFLYINTKCEGKKSLNFQLNYFVSSEKYGVSDRYYILHDSKFSVDFHFWSQSSVFNFPPKAYHNEKEFIIIKTTNTYRYYIYKTNKVGDYQISYLTKDLIKIPFKTIYVREKSEDYFNIIQPLKKCFYYRKEIQYKIKKNQIVEPHEIVLQRSKFKETKLSCTNDNICSFDLNSRGNNLYYLYAKYENLDSDIRLLSEYDKNNVLYHDKISFTTLKTEPATYSFNRIILEANCFLENIKMKKATEDNNYIDLNCQYYMKKKKMDCETLIPLTYGLYNFYDEDFTLLETHTFVSRPIEKSDLYTGVTTTTIGSNTIRFISTDFYVMYIKKVVIKDDFSKIIIYEFSKNLWKYVNIVSDSINNYIDVTFTAHPEKTYSIQFFTSQGCSKVFEFTPISSSVEISFNKKYHIMNLELSYLPKITFSQGYYDQITRVYYKNIKTKNNRFDDGEIEGSVVNNQKVFTFRPNKPGTYKFGYYLNNNFDNKYDILNRKIIIGRTIFDLILFYPPGTHIPKNSNVFSLDIIPLYNMNLLVSLCNMDLTEIRHFTHTSGNNYYNLTLNNLDIEEDTLYKLVIRDMNDDNNLLYKQDIEFTYFDVRTFYYLSEIKSIGGIIINVSENKSLSNLYIEYEDFDEHYKLGKEEGTNIAEILYEYNNFNDLGEDDEEDEEEEEFSLEPGKYTLYYDGSEIEEIFISKNLEDLTEDDLNVYPISGKNNLVIKSNTFNVQDIIQIEIELKDGRKINSIPIIKKKEYISFPNIQIDSVRITKIYTSKGSVSINCLIKEEDIYNFKLMKSYQIPTKDEEQLLFQFDVPQDTTILKLKEIFSRIYIDNELKILGKDEKCTYGSKGIVQCKFTSPIRNKELVITYNEFTTTTQKYYYFIYSYEDDTCLVDKSINDNDKFYIKFNDIINFNISLYNKDNNIRSSLIKYGNYYYFNKSILNYGNNIIQLHYGDTIIDLEEIGYYPQFNAILNPSKYIISEAEFENSDDNIDNLSQVNSYIYIKGEKIEININIGGSQILANFGNIGEGVYTYYFGDKCEKEIHKTTVRVYKDDEQLLIEINPNYINKNDKEESYIFLTYSNDFNPSNRPKYIQLVHKSNHLSVENSVFNNLHVHLNKIRFSISSDIKAKIPNGKYLIKTVFGNGIDEMVSIKEFFVVQKLALYEKKQIIDTKSTSIINKIGVIFTTPILNNIEKVMYENKYLENTIHEKYQNILIIKINKTLPVNKDLIFEIYERDSQDPLIYKLYLKNQTNDDSDLRVSHNVYKISEDGYAYLTISGNDIYNATYEIGSGDRENIEKLWHNTFIQKVNEVRSYKYKFNHHLDTYTFLSNQTIHVVDISSFIKENVHECQINYCSFEDEFEDCFRDLMFEKKLELPIDSSIIYSLTSIDTDENIELNFKEKDDKLIPDNSLESKYPNNKYKLLIKRKDNIDTEPFILFSDRTFIFTDLKLKSFEFQGEYVIARFETLCIDESKLSVNNAIFKGCPTDIIDSNIKICSFELEKKVELTYYLSYGNIEIAEVSPKLATTYKVNAEMNENGKAKFTVETTNPSFGPQNIVYFTICDMTSDNYISLGEEYINYYNNYAYVEVPEYKLSKSIYFCEFELDNDLKYPLKLNEENEENEEINVEINNLVVTFEHVSSVSPEIIFSYQDMDEIKFKVNSLLNNVYLNSKEKEHFIGGCTPKKDCTYPLIDYGVDYMINSYHNVILHTYKFSFDSQCINKDYDNIEDSSLKIYGETFPEKLSRSNFILTDSNTNFKLTYNPNNANNPNNVLDINISLRNLNGKYYMIIDKQQFKDYHLIVIKSMDILDTFGDLYSLSYTHDQYLIVNFNHILKDNYDVNNVILKNDVFIYNLYCENLFNNDAGLICKTNEILNKGKYNIGYIDKCGNKIMSNKKIDINASSNPLPKADLIKHVKRIENKDIIFDKTISNAIIDKIELLKTTKGVHKENLLFKINTNSVTITINNISRGNYIIVIYYKDGTKIVIPQVVVNYDSFKIINGKKITNKPFNIKNTKIYFEGEFYSNLVQKVQLFTPNGYKDINYIIPKDGTKNGFITIIENEEIGFGEYRIELSGDVDTYYYFIYCIFIEKGSQNIDNGITLNRNNIFFDFTIKGSNDMSYFREIVKTVKSNEMEFKIHYCEIKYCRIGVYKYNERDFRSVRIILVTFIIDIDEQILELNVNVKVYPKKFILDNIPFLNRREYVTLHTSSHADNEYITLLPDYNNYLDIIYLSKIGVYKTVFPYHPFESFIYDSDFYYLYQLNHKIEDYSVIFKHPIKVDFITFIFKLFECNKPGHFYNIQDTVVTCDACSKIYPNKPYKSHIKNECVNKCPLGGYLYKHHKQCYSNCAQAKSRRPLLHDSGVCVFECMKNHGKYKKDSDFCYDCQLKGDIEEYGMCIPNPNKNYRYHEIDVSVNSCNDYKCENNGKCYIKNDYAYCKCPENKYGFRCELSYKEAYKKLRSIISEFLSCESYYFYPIEERGRNYYDEDNNIIYDLTDERNIILIKEISALAKEPRLLNKVVPSKRNKLFHVISTMIIKMKEGFVDSSSAVLELIDLGMNLCSSTAEIKRLTLLRLLDENEEEDPDDKDQFDDDTEYPEFNGLESLSNLIEDARETYKVLTVNELENGNYGLDKVSSDYSKSRKLYYQRWSPSKESYTKLQNQINGNDEMTFIDFSSCVNDSSVFLTTITLPSNLNQLITDSNSSSSFTDVYESDKGIYSMDYFDLSDCHSIFAYFPINNSYVDLQKYKKYKDIGVDIFKNDANIYYDTCYVTNDFDYDLTQKYRRTQIFENKTFTSPDCSYLNIDLDMKKVKMQCNYVENFTYYYKVSNLNLNIKDLDKVENLPLKCFSSIGNITRNIGFYIYLILMILILSSLIFNILHYNHVYMKKEKKENNETNESEKDVLEKPNNEIQKSRMRGLSMNINEKNDNLDNIDNLEVIRKGDIENNIIIYDKKNEEDEKDKEDKEDKNIEEEEEGEEEEKEEEEKKETTTSNRKLHAFDDFFEEERPKEEEEIVEIGIIKDENKESFSKILGNNFLHHHPLLRFSRITYFKPILTNIALFAFNCSLIFGTNAAFYFENLIEKRIYDENRNKFTYPFKYEIVKMILSLLTSIFGMVIIRLIMIISRKKVRQIREFNEKKHFTNEKEFRKLFELKGYLIRRIISCIVMLVITCFFFIYCLVFCSVYKNTQFNWFVGGILCLLFEFFILAPIYILIISIVEKKGGIKKTTSFYMKKLLLF